MTALDGVAAAVAPHIADAAAPGQVATLTNAAGLRVQVLDHGATLLACSVPLAGGERRDVVLAAPDVAAYQRQQVYLGAVVGRYANRVRAARFQIGGVPYNLTPNEHGNQLHGGPSGFSRRCWRFVEVAQDMARLALVSPDGDQGYPGQVHAQACYRLRDGLVLELTLTATTTRACPVSLTSHAYFNLDGDARHAGADCLDHVLQVDAAHWLPVNAQLLPCGGFVPVSVGGMDLRTPRRLRDAIAAGEATCAAGGIDHCYSLNPHVRDGTAPAAVLTARDALLTMQLHTDAPALQVYSGAYLGGTPAAAGGHYGGSAGIALEPQFAPDSPNRPPALPHWPDCVLQPGRRFERVIRYTFVPAR